jgi:serine-type D-Ala-D-Ala carboxypeptidase/endopeptidase
MRCRLTLLTCLLLCSSLPAQNPTAPLTLESADPLGAQLFAASGSTGMVMVVIRNHDIFFHGYGETYPGSGQHPTESSVLRLCSLSKIFATDLLNKLVKDGTVHLTDPLQQYASPGVEVPTRDGKPITLENLATHTAGLPREIGPAPRDTPHFTYPGYAHRWTWLPTAHLVTTPGTVASYSNLGFDYLGDALAHAANEPYATLFATRINQPLGLHETTFTPNADQCARLLRGTHDQGPCTDTQNSAASAGVYSTAADITRWLEYLLGNNQPEVPMQDLAAQNVYIQPQDLLHQIGLEHAGDPTGIGVGWIHIFDGTPSELIQKTGGGAGFTTYIAISHPTNTAIFVAFTDSSTPTHYNVFKGANNILYQLNGLPLMTIDLPKPTPRPSSRRKRRSSR